MGRGRGDGVVRGDARSKRGVAERKRRPDVADRRTGGGREVERWRGAGGGSGGRTMEKESVRSGEGGSKV